ncbi:MAG: hypothetical protein ACTHW1_06235 [Ancrocorticia sp.]|uniref:hypothetical protein n=1 Tax=Ancrocorticia sp. TaxID=2593684 RepID=UPI003F8E09E5
MTRTVVGPGVRASASRPGRSRWLTPAPLVFAALVLAIAAIGVGVIGAAYSGTTARDQARTPIIPDDSSDAELLYIDVHDSLLNAPEDTMVVYLLPLNDDAPLPAGVHEWPEEGEVLLSPALLAAGQSEGIESRYGTFAGTIDLEGLASPTEKIAYVRPGADVVDEQSMYPASGFGAQTDSGMFQDALEREPVWRFFAAYGMTIGLAVVLVCVVSSRSGLEHRRRCNLVLLTLGFSTRDRIWWQAEQIWRPVIAGSFIGLVSSLPWYVADIKLPWRNYVVLADDVRANALWIILLALLVIASFVGLLLGQSVRVPTRIALNRPKDREKPYSTVKAGICVFSVPIAIILMILVNKGAALLLFVLYLAVLLTVIVTVQDLVALCMSWWARPAKDKAASRNDPGGLIGSAGILWSGRRLTQLALILVATALITSQVLIMLIARASFNKEALASYEEFSGQVAEMYPVPGARTDQIKEMLDALHQTEPDATILITRVDTGDENPVMEIGALGDGLDDTVISGTTPDDLLNRYVHYTIEDKTAGSTKVVPQSELLVFSEEQRENWDITYNYAVVAGESGSVDVSHIKQVVAEYSAPMWRVNEPSASFYYGTSAGVQRANWIGWMGLVGLGMLLTGVCFALVEDATRTARRLAPLTVLSGSPGVIRRVAADRVCVPLAVGYLIGMLLSLMLGSALAMSMGSAIAQLIPFVLAAGLMTGVVAFVGWVAAIAESRRAFSMWKVGTK